MTAISQRAPTGHYLLENCNVPQPSAEAGAHVFLGDIPKGWEDLKTHMTDKIGKYLNAFLNNDGGFLYFGIKKTRRGGEVFGVQRTRHVFVREISRLTTF
jgi:hypothetical protein